MRPVGITQPQLFCVKPDVHLGFRIFTGTNIRYPVISGATCLITGQVCSIYLCMTKFNLSDDRYVGTYMYIGVQMMPQVFKRIRVGLHVYLR